MHGPTDRPCTLRSWLQGNTRPVFTSYAIVLLVRSRSVEEIKYFFYI